MTCNSKCTHMQKVSSKNERSARLAGTTKYDAHHTVLSKTYGALADLRRELADSKSRVAEREELLRVFSGCADSQRPGCSWRITSRSFRFHGRTLAGKSGGRA